MAKKAGLSQQFFIGGYDLSGDVGSLNNVSSPRGVLVMTAINKAAQERVLGLTDGIIDFATWFDDAALLSHVALKGLPTADRNVIWALGATVGDVAAQLIAKQINYDWTRGQDKSLAGRVLCQGNDTPLEWGEMLTAGKVTHTGATNGTALNNTAGATTGGLAGYIQCFAFTGTSVTVVIQESSDNGVGDPWATKLSFAAITAGQSAERKTATGSVEQYLRISSSGTFTSADLVVSYRRGDTQDEKTY